MPRPSAQPGGDELNVNTAGAGDDVLMHHPHHPHHPHSSLRQRLMHFYSGDDHEEASEGSDDDGSEGDEESGGERDRRPRRPARDESRAGDSSIAHRVRARVKEPKSVNAATLTNLKTRLDPGTVAEWCDWALSLIHI